MKNYVLAILLFSIWLGVSAVQAASSGSVAAWGANHYGQTTVPVLAQSEVMAIAAGQGHTVALKTNGSVLAWGANCCGVDHGQTTVPVAAQSGVPAISSGSDHVVVLKNDGSVVVWGHNGQG